MSMKENIFCNNLAKQTSNAAIYWHYETGYNYEGVICRELRWNSFSNGHTVR